MRKDQNMAQPSKGKRDPFTVRVPVDFAEIILSKAKEEGFRFTGDYFVELASRALDMPEFSTAPKRSDELDIPGEAHTKAA